MAASTITSLTVTAFLRTLANVVPPFDANNPPKLFVSNHRAFNHGNNTVMPFTVSAAFNAAGEASLVTIETASVGEKLEFQIVIPDGDSLRTISFEPAVTPNSDTADISTFTQVKPFDLA